MSHLKDRNGDGRPGGSLPFEQRGLDDVVTLATALGIRIDRRWERASFEGEIAAAKETPEGKLAYARFIASSIRKMWPTKAAEIDQAVADTEAGKRDGIDVQVGIRFRLEKFDGDIHPDKRPVEVIEGLG